jgi:hypothetical protein
MFKLDYHSFTFRVYSLSSYCTCIFFYNENAVEINIKQNEENL